MANKAPIKIGKLGRSNSLLYAFLVAGFLLWQSFSLEYNKEDGWKFETKIVPVQICVPAFAFMAIAVGINLRDELLIIALAVSRNSRAIEELAQKSNIQIDSENIQENIISNDDKQS